MCRAPPLSPSLPPTPHPPTHTTTTTALAQLVVRGCRSIYDSFAKFTEEETLDGDNKYEAEGHGRQVGCRPTGCGSRRAGWGMGLLVGMQAWWLGCRRAAIDACWLGCRRGGWDAGVLLLMHAGWDAGVVAGMQACCY